MDNEMRNMIIFITASSAEEGEKISKSLLEEKLVACVNILPQVNSSYWWQGKIETSKEVMLIAKTSDSLVNNVIERVKQIHSYDVPEIIAVSITGGNKDYLKWISDSVKK